MMNALIDALPLGPGVCALAWDPCGLVALSKPEGVLSHPNKGERSANTLVRLPYDEALQAYTAANKGLPALHLLHRLDSATSGVILLATNETTAQWARAAIADQRMEKIYFACVKGRLRSMPGFIWKDRLSKSSANNQLRVQAGGEIIAKTHFAVEKSAPALDISLLKLRPLTGRTHQLRIQSALHGCPIIGDKTYGDFTFNRRAAELLGSKRLMLHAFSVRLPLPKRGYFEARSPLPDVFLALFQSNS